MKVGGEGEEWKISSVHLHLKSSPKLSRQRRGLSSLSKSGRKWWKVRYFNYVLQNENLVRKFLKWQGETFFVPKVLRCFIFARLELWYNIGEDE